MTQTKQSTGARNGMLENAVCAAKFMQKTGKSFGVMPDSLVCLMVKEFFP
jgi:hypothetical protein